MNVIKRKTLIEYGRRFADAKGQLDAWYHEVERSGWLGPQDLKERYPSASLLRNNVVVFNIKGNRYRLIVRVDYQAQVVYVTWFGPHAEYDRLTL
jgi:mRNA interferase HigB